jgi:hypothetical protein
MCYRLIYLRLLTDISASCNVKAGHGKPSSGGGDEALSRYEKSPIRFSDEWI